MHSKPKNYSQLQPEERLTLASLKPKNYSIGASRNHPLPAPHT